VKRILITGAGGAPSTNFIRSLRASGEPFYIIGVDCNPYYLQRAQTEERFMVPYANDPTYMPILLEIIEKTRPQMIYSQPDQEIEVISKHRQMLLDEWGVRTFLPSDASIQLCQDKFLSTKRWAEAGLIVPDVMLIQSEADVEAAFEKYGAPIWIRANYSPGGGRGAFRAENLREARGWLDFSDGWDGSFCAAECLTSRSVTWMALYNEGELVVAQGRRREYWEFANRAPSGVTGITGTGVTISDPVVDEIAPRVISAIDDEPHGIWSVDLCYDKEGVPNPTEINIGRFFTTHQFFTRAGLNLPYIFTKIAFGEEPPTIARKVNPLTPGLAWVRGMDIEPVLTEFTAVERAREQLAAAKARAQK